MSIFRLPFLPLLLFLIGNVTTAIAQEDDLQPDSNAVATNSFWDNWYVDFGVDMNLLKPHEHSFKNTFPNGKSFGINAAIGKWFSPEIGARFKVTWNNGILKNDHNTWLAPYGVPGENHRQGGFITLLGDIQLNIHNLFDEYKPDRMWNLIVAPRGGAWIHVGSGSGAHVLGVGVINTFRINEKWNVMADAGYHFVSSVNGVFSGKGHGSNGFVEIGVGMELKLGNSEFQKASKKPARYERAVATNSFWANWFAQVGLGMSLINPYGTNFNYVFPNGKTLGINLGVGKWFTPEIGVRGGLNWQNGIFKNHHASYLDSQDGTANNADEHGFAAVYADLFLNLHNVIGGYDENRKWNAIFYPRMGFGRNFASSNKGECPLVGLGTEHTYKINDRLKLFADLAYQVTTGGFLDGKFDTGANGSNGWFDLNIGIQYELGKSKGKWKKLND